MDTTGCKALCLTPQVRLFTTINCSTVTGLDFHNKKNLAVQGLLLKKSVQMPMPCNFLSIDLHLGNLYNVIVEIRFAK